MNSSSANFLDALGASQTLSAQMKHELDTLGYTVVQVDISEFEKLEGCVTCLSIRIR